MNLLPAIDLKDGHCVRLEQGRFDKVTTYAENPVAVAMRYLEAGARKLHVVDLDGARTGVAQQTGVLSRIAQIDGLEIQVGGGLRSIQEVTALLAVGAKRIVLGSLAIRDIAATQQILSRFGGDVVVVALDVKFDSTGSAVVVSHGWQRQSGLTLWELLDAYEGSGLRYVLCTDVSRDGMMIGPNLSLYKTLRLHFPNLRIQASGGVGSLADLMALKSTGVDGVIIGKALYENRFSIEEALACSTA